MTSFHPTKSPMLAGKLESTLQLKGPMLASPKLDGVRALIIDGVVYSRKFKRIPNQHVQNLFGKKSLSGLDGELIVGDPTDPECFRNTMSGVMSEQGKPEVYFHAFDDFTSPHSSFEVRLRRVFQRTSSHKNLLYVNHVLVTTDEQLQHFEEQCLVRGYEGVMLRHRDGPYKEGRSTVKEGWLLKLKRFEDSEAEILGSFELMENTNEKKIGSGGKLERSHHKAGLQGKGTLGGFHVRDVKTGVEFDIGSGFKQADREIFWEIREELKGEILTYQFFPAGSKDKPRFPTFKGLRSFIDF